MAFLAEVVDILERPSAPEASPDCSYCQFLLDGVAGFLGSWVQVQTAEAPSADRRGKRPHPHLELVIQAQPRLPRQD